LSSRAAAGARPTRSRSSAFEPVDLALNGGPGLVGARDLRAGDRLALACRAHGPASLLERVQRHAELLAHRLGLLARVLGVAARHPEPLARGAELALQRVAPVREFLALARRRVAVDLQPPRLLAQLARLPVELLEPLPGGGDRAARLVSAATRSASCSVASATAARASPCSAAARARSSAVRAPNAWPSSRSRSARSRRDTALRCRSSATAISPRSVSTPCRSDRDDARQLVPRGLRARARLRRGLAGALGLGLPQLGLRVEQLQLGEPRVERRELVLPPAISRAASVSSTAKRRPVSSACRSARLRWRRARAPAWSPR
jgi:hypothetical protein